MKLITKDIDYAVKALCRIARDNEKIMSVKELAKELNIPKPFLRKILQILQKDGILKSYKGPNGGFLLASSPEEILLIRIIEIFQGPLKLNECLFRRGICADTTTCVIKGKIDKIERRVISELRVITLASLLEKRRKSDDTKKR